MTHSITHSMITQRATNEAPRRHALSLMAPCAGALLLFTLTTTGCLADGVRSRSSSADQASKADAADSNLSAPRERRLSRGIISREELLALAKRYIGIPYKFGGASPAGFDCSGYTSYVYGKAGYKLPHGARPQHELLNKTKQPKPGDLVFFRTYTPNVSHVGIYTGDNQFLHSPTTGRTVSYASMTSSYWKARYVGAGTPYAASGGNEPGPKTGPKQDPKKEPAPKVTDPDLLDFEMIQAIYAGNESDFTKFLNMGARPNATYKEWSALMLAAHFNRISMLQQLIARKVDVNYRAPRGWTAMSIAKEQKHAEIERILFAAGAVRSRAIGKPPAMPNPGQEQF